jgi:hypothetical protein
MPAALLFLPLFQAQKTRRLIDAITPDNPVFFNQKI